MTDYTDARRLREHAAEHPLLERLRGRHFIPGMHYATQAEAWMEEAATEIERLRSTTAPANAGGLRLAAIIPVSRRHAEQLGERPAVDRFEVLLASTHYAPAQTVETWTGPETIPESFALRVEFVVADEKTAILDDVLGDVRAEVSREAIERRPGGFRP